MKSSYFGLILWLSVFFLTGCKKKPDKVAERIQEIMDGVKAEFAPDKRVALFEVVPELNANKYVLKGESNLPEAVAALTARLATDSIAFIDSIQLLPASTLDRKIRAIVSISVANLRSNAAHSSELATQATLGTVLKVYKQQDEWYYVQTPDGYLAWVDEGGIELVDEQKAKNWQDDPKIIYTKTYGHAYSDPYDDNHIVSDLVAGSLLSVTKDMEENYMVRFPDGRNACVRKWEATIYDDWLQDLNATPQTLVATSQRLMGVPYLWGGTSTKGVDCSGFTKTVYFLNGMVIPRDASQQVHTGIPIDSTGNFRALQQGDLLFFGKKATDSTKEKVVHVGMWIGDNKFIHASGKVRVSSVDRASEDFDAYNLNRYLRTKRVFKQQGQGLVDLTSTGAVKE